MQVTNNGAAAYQSVQAEVKPGTAAPTATAVKPENKSGETAIATQADTVTLSPEALALSGGEVKTMGNTLPPWPTNEN